MGSDIALVIGLSAGCVIGAIISYAVAKERIGAHVLEAEKRAAAAGATVNSVAEQVQRRDLDLKDLRAKLETEQKARTAAETALEDERKLLLDQKSFLDGAQTRLTSAFQGLAAQALIENNNSFLALATESFTNLRHNAVTEIKTLVEPLGATLNVYQNNLQAIETARQQAYGGMTETLRSVGETQEFLREQTANLVTALRSPQARGRWGELTLKRVAELTGMSEHCDFEEQPTITTENGQLRPDMIINLPKGVIVPVDAKVPLNAYLDAIGVTTPEERKRHLQRHAAAVRERMRTLSSKEYESQFRNTPGVTVLFLPSDAFLSAALEDDRSLLEDAMQRKVVIATPVSLFSLLKAVAYGWQQDTIAQNAATISDLGRELYDRIQSLWTHLDNLRSGLIHAVDGFDATIGSLEARVFPSARKFKELGASSASDIEVMDKISRSPRALSASAAVSATSQKSED